jgi:hypothetical protein
MRFARKGERVKLRDRIYADYLSPCRFEEYERLLHQALEAGFKHCTVYGVYSALRHKTSNFDDKIFVHRHDVDTDCTTARMLFYLEKKFGVKATYYFRLSTLDVRLMAEIREYGSEVGYHYEELATYAKRFGLRSKDEVLKHIDPIRAEFERNFKDLEKRLGFKLNTVASHGDFANRKLGLLNTLILEDKALRERLSIECEAYDDILMSFFDVYLSDGPPRDYYPRGSPFAALSTAKRIYLLTHERHWRTNIVANTIDNVTRAFEELMWRAL